MRVILLILMLLCTLNADLSRSGNIVSDSTTNLQWQDDKVVGETYTTRTWTEAIDYCEALSLDTHDDWLLPSKDELLSIIIISDPQKHPAIDDSVFNNTVSAFYWSSTINVDDEERVWYVDFYDGNTDHFYGSNYFYVRCVRDGQFDILEIPSIPEFIMATDAIESTVDVKWSVVTDATYYNLYRSESSSDIGTIIDIAHTNSFIDTTVVTDTLYYYRIEACNDSGCSDFTTADSGYIGNPTTTITKVVVIPMS